MKFLAMAINAVFDNTGMAGLYVHKNNKIDQGLPIKDYLYHFKDENEAVKNIDLLINDKDYLKGIVVQSLDFYDSLKRREFNKDSNTTKELRYILRKQKNIFRKKKVKEKIYYLAVDIICEDNIKVNLMLTGTIL